MYIGMYTQFSTLCKKTIFQAMCQPLLIFVLLFFLKVHFMYIFFVHFKMDSMLKILHCDIVKIRAWNFYLSIVSAPRNIL